MTENAESVSSVSDGSNATDTKKTPPVKEEKPDKSSKLKKSSNPWYSKKKPGHIQYQSTTKITEPEFKGTITDMNGHTFQCHGESTTASQFSRTCDELQRYCLKTYRYGDDVAFIVRHSKEYNMNKNKPSPAPSNADAIDLRIVDKEVDEYVKRKATYIQNKKSLYMVIWAQSSNAMQAKLKSINGFNDFDEERDCLALLMSIKGISYKFEAQRYPPLALFDAKAAFYRYQQHKTLSNSDYLEKFKALYTIIEHYGGSIGEDPMLIKDEARRDNIMHYNDLTITDNEYIQRVRPARDRYLAYAFIHGSDKSRYAELMIELENQHTYGNDQFPKTLTGAYNLLVNYRTKMRKSNYDGRHEEKKENDFTFATGFNTLTNDKGEKVNKQGVPLKCYKCGGTHYSNDPSCPKATKIDPVKSYSSNDTIPVPSNKIPSSSSTNQQVDSNFVMTLLESDDKNEGLDRKIDLNIGDDQPSFGELCFSIIPLILKNNKSGWLNDNHLILDTGSTVTIFKNKNLLSNIYSVPFDQQLTVFCNSGEQKNAYRGTCPGLGDVWHNTGSLANIVSFSLLSDLFTMEYDQNNHQFKCYISDKKTLCFKRKGGLYVYDATQDLNHPKHQFTFIQTVAQNKTNFSATEISKAEHARRLYITLGRPSLRTFRWMLLHKKIKNSTLLPKDADNAEIIFGPDIGSLKGKTVRRRPKQVNIPVTIPIGIPDDIMTALKSVTLCADIFYVDKLKFVVTLSRNLHFGTVEYIINRKQETIFEAMTNVLALYTYFNFTVRSLLTDGEFNVLKDKFLEKGVLLNVAAAHEHVGDIERYIRVIKERVRAVIATLPFDHFPRILRREIILFAVSALNMTIRLNGVTPHHSPTSIVTGQELDVNKNCSLPFGGYCQVGYYDEPRNDTEIARTIDALALRPTGNAQGGYFFLRIDTWKRISRHDWKELPMPDNIIDIINDYGEAQTSDDDNFIFKRNDKSFLTSLAVQDNHLLQDFLQDEGAYDTAPQINYQDENEIDRNDNDDNPDDALREENNSVASNDVELEPILEHDDENNSIDISHDADNANDNHVDSVEARSDDDLSYDSSSIDEAIHDIDSSIAPDNIINPTLDNNRPSTKRYALRRSNDITYNEKELKNNTFSLHISTEAQQAPKKPAQLIWNYDNRFAYAFTQMSAREGLKRYGEKAAEALIAEWKQLDDKKVFHGVKFKDTTPEQRSKALRLVQLIKEKRCGKIKGRTCADGRKQRAYINQEDSTSPTVSTEALLITLMIDANENRDVATADVPGAFLHSDIDEETFVVVDGALVDILVKSNNKYAKYIHITSTGKKLVFLQLDKALYGTVMAARLFFDNLSGVLKEYGFVANEYDVCVMNKMINGKQCTVVWHVDDLKLSHVDSKVVDEVLQHLSTIYGELSVTRGDSHTYVGMAFYFPGDTTVQVDMSGYLKEAVEEFPEDVTKLVTSPASNYIFDVNPDCPKLNDEKRELLHHLVAKLLFVSTRARPDIHLPISFLTSRVTKADDDDWKKLKRLMQYINSTIDLHLTLSAENMNVIKWWVDVAYGVRDDYKSQTGRAMTFGRGTIMNKSTKQKLNTNSSTEAELVGASDSVPQIVWTNYFVSAQGYSINDTILYQDNTSAISMEKNGKLSSSKRTKHINIRYFFIQDRIKNGEITVKYCPTDQMLADYFTKPLQGAKFILFRDMILGINDIDFTG